ncbi:hypothetical protein V3C99_007812 [Haemonchus contortus]|nr:Protein C05D9.9, isoform b [Haemonchus contortus]
MWSRIIIFILSVGLATSYVAVYEVMIGGRLKIFFPQDVVTWKRVRKAGVEEFIKYCAEGEKNPRCSGFVTADNKPALPESANASVLANGTLIINPFRETDVGTYTSPDLQPGTCTLKGGGTAMIPPSVIHVEVMTDIDTKAERELADRLLATLQT